MSDQVETTNNEQPTEPVGPTNQKATTEPVEGLEDRMKRMEAAMKNADREAARYRKLVEQFEAEKKAKADAELSEAEKLRKELAEVQSALKAKEIADLQRQAAEKAGLPMQLASRLKGETPDEIEADAKALADTLPKQPKIPMTPTNPPNAKPGKTDEQILADVFGRPTNPFDLDLMKATGGGVYHVEKEGNNV